LPTCEEHRLVDEGSVSSLPSEHQIGAALWVIGLLSAPRMTIAAARDAYAQSVSGGIFDEEAMLAGEELLIASELVALDGNELVVAADAASVHGLDGITAARVITIRLLERDPPVWLRAAAGGEQVRAELIPDADLAILDGLLVAVGIPRDLVLLTAVRRWEERHLAGLALSGVMLVEQLCREELISADQTELADQVMRFDDASPALACNLVAPAPGGAPRRLLVRTTRQLSWRGPVLLTRDQIEIGRADPSWALVICESDAAGAVELAGWCRADALDTMLPTEPHPHGRWTIISVQLVQELLMPGLPPS
jgi:hypothetical protein